MWLGFDSGRRRHNLCGLRKFSPGAPVFPSHQTQTFPNSFRRVFAYYKAHLIILSWNYALYTIYNTSFSKFVIPLNLAANTIASCGVTKQCSTAILSDNSNCFVSSRIWVCGSSRIIQPNGIKNGMAYLLK